MKNKSQENIALTIPKLTYKPAVVVNNLTVYDCVKRTGESFHGIVVKNRNIRILARL
jgi:hypothetical protein